MKEWREEAASVAGSLELDNSPISVTFTNDTVESGERLNIQMCRALKAAAEGRSFLIDKETSACPGGSWHCGLVEPPSGEAARVIKDFLTRGEKLTHSIVSFQRMMNTTSPPPTGLGDRIFIGPMGEAPIRPDLAVFLCNPETACRLITLDYYWDGVAPRVDVSGSLCHSVIAYPVVTGNTNISLGDWTARRMQKYEPASLFVSIPYERIRNLVLAIPECSAGTAETLIPETILDFMEEG